jgi:hypothetical protein
MKEIELLIRKSTLKDVELCLVQEKDLELWLAEQYSEIENELNNGVKK